MRGAATTHNLSKYTPSIARNGGLLVDLRRRRPDAAKNSLSLPGEHCDCQLTWSVSSGLHLNQGVTWIISAAMKRTNSGRAP